MAPTKRKKKAVSNPARGFTTVSLPSKSRPDEAPPELNASLKEPDDSKLANGISDQNINDGNDQASFLQGLTPEQFEEHLNDAELQSFLDSYAQRSKREAARQVTRLEVERRTLRAQAMPLDAASWRTDDLIEDIIKASISETPTSREAGTVSLSTEGKSADELLVKLWTLQQVLKAIRIEQNEQVLKHVMCLSCTYSLTSKEYIWGLEEAFDWLASHARPNELPSYHNNSLASNIVQGDSVFHTSNVDNSRENSPSPSSPYHDNDKYRWGQPNKSIDTSHQDTEEKVVDSGPLSSIDINESTDDDNDPEELVNKYIKAKSDLLKAELNIPTEGPPDMSDYNNEFPSILKMDQLRQRIGKIERDVLFDTDAAGAQWAETSKCLRIGFAGAEARRSSSSQHGRNAVQIQDPEELSQYQVEHIDAAAEKELDETGLFGDMFAQAESYVPQRNQSVPNEPGNSIVLTDFGKWTGVSPRKILEDTCKARDPGCKILFHLISPSSYSNRHRLEITWSKHQEQVPLISALPSMLKYDFGPSTATISMESISTPTATQSEAYISTVTLFALFANDTKEEKPSIRLSSAWRDLWKDLSQQRQRDIASSDKSVVKMLRKLIAEEVAQHRNKTTSPSFAAAIETRNTNDPESRNISLQRQQRTAEQLKAEWSHRASTKAYQIMLQARQQLPIFDQKGTIVQILTTQQLTILCADTGAGKSTQVPAYILEHELSLGHDCRIFVTQPRRISAMSLARRVSQELGEGKNDLGTRRSLVGYAIRLERKTSDSTRITYATTGVLLRMLESSPDLREIDYLVLDEVHERTRDLDLLFIVIRRLTARRSSLRVVLMSATVDAEKIANYFGGAQILSIPGRTYPVEVRYLEDAVEATLDLVECNDSKLLDFGVGDSYGNFDENEVMKSVAKNLEYYSPKTRALLATYDEYRIDYAMITNLTSTIASHTDYVKYSQAILIFLPGIGEIRRLHQAFLSHPSFIQGWSFFLLHSSFSTEELDRAFLPAPAGMRKIVIATNIAETGITIPDITTVIDTCKEKTMRFDERRQLSKLTENFISRSSARQRRGRAARVQNGLCFHLVTKYRHDVLMPEQHVPEMLRLSLQDPILRIKMWGLGEIDQTLSEALDPPSSRNVRRAVDALKELKALSASESLSPIGRQLARLPLDVWLGKLALTGIVLGCLDAAITIASILSAKSPFLAFNSGHAAAESAKAAFSRGESDLLLSYNAYLAWRRACHSGLVYEFCRKNFLDQQALSQIEDQKVQLLVSLADARLLKLKDAEMSSLRKARLSGSHREFFLVPERYNVSNNSDSVITSLIALAFYPKLLVREGRGWRNVSTNQQVSIASTSINKTNSKPPRWLSFYQAMQSKSRHLNVFDTSAVPESAIVLLLGDADFRLFSGVIAVDGSRIRFRVNDWRSMIALKILRSKIQEALAFLFRHPGKALTTSPQRWFDLWKSIAHPAVVRIE